VRGAAMTMVIAAIAIVFDIISASH